MYVDEIPLSSIPLFATFIFFQPQGESLELVIRISKNPFLPEKISVKSFPDIRVTIRVKPSFTRRLIPQPHFISLQFFFSTSTSQSAMRRDFWGSNQPQRCQQQKGGLAFLSKKLPLQKAVEIHVTLSGGLLLVFVGIDKGQN